jgi:hypothetical protein
MKKMRFKRIAIAVLAAALGLPGRLGAAQARTPTPDPRPSVELLEFLADWETDDGQWAGPDFFDPALPPVQEPNNEIPQKP